MAPFKKLQPTSSAATSNYLDALRRYANTVKPVFRYTCPPGYSANVEDADFPTDAEMATKIGKLWFIDQDGHACKPTAGWGTQPALGVDDELARMYRERDSKLTADQITKSKNELLCSPCNRSCLSKKSVSCAADSLISTISDIQSMDRGEKDAAGTYTYTLGGGMSGMSMSGTSEAPSLIGGAKMSDAAKCAVQEMVKGLTAEQRRDLQTNAVQVVQQYNVKRTDKAKNELDCLLSEDRVRCIEANLRNELNTLKADLPADAVACSEASYLGESSAKCSPSASCLSSARKINALEVMKKKLKAVEPKKRLYKDTMKVFMKYRSYVRSCGGVATSVTGDEERKYKSALAVAYHKYYRSIRECKTDDEIVAEVDPVFEQFKACAVVCAPEGCPPGGKCVPSKCGSSVCVPSELSKIKTDAKELSRLEPVVDDLSEWWSKFYAEHQ